MEYIKFKEAFMKKKKEGLKLTRREFLKGTLATGAVIGLGGAGVLVNPRMAYAAANSPNLAKWIQPIRGLGPGGIPTLSGVADPVFGSTTFYQVTVGEFTDQLHPALGPTRLWGYRQTGTPVLDQRHLGGVIITARGQAARIPFTNTSPTPYTIPVVLIIR